MLHLIDPDDRMYAAEIEEHVSDSESEHEAVDIADQLERDVTTEQLDFAKGKCEELLEKTCCH